MQSFNHIEGRKFFHSTEVAQILQLYLDARLLQRCESLILHPDPDVRKKVIRIFYNIVHPLAAAGVGILSTQPFSSISDLISSGGWVYGLVKAADVSSSSSSPDEAVSALNCLKCLGTKRHWTKHWIVYNVPKVITMLEVSSVTKERAKEAAISTLDTFSLRIPDALDALIDLDMTTNNSALVRARCITLHSLIEEIEDLMFGGTLSELQGFMCRLDLFTALHFPEPFDVQQYPSVLSDDYQSIVHLAVSLSKTLLSVIKILESSSEKSKVNAYVAIGMHIIKFIQRVLFFSCSVTPVEMSLDGIERCLNYRGDEASESYGLIVCLERLIGLTPTTSRQVCSPIKVGIMECLISFIKVPNKIFLELGRRVGLFTSFVNYMKEYSEFSRREMASKHSTKYEDFSFESVLISQFWRAMITSKCSQTHTDIVKTDILHKICREWSRGSAPSIMNKDLENCVQITAYRILYTTLILQEVCPILVAEIERCLGSFEILNEIGEVSIRSYQPGLSWDILSVFILFNSRIVDSHLEREKVPRDLLNCLRSLSPLNKLGFYLWSRHFRGVNRGAIEVTEYPPNSDIHRSDEGDWKVLRLKHVNLEHPHANITSDDLNFSDISIRKNAEIKSDSFPLTKPLKYLQISSRKLTNSINSDLVTTAIDRMGILLVGVKAAFDNDADILGCIDYDKVIPILVRLRLSGESLINASATFKNLSERHSADNMDFPTFIGAYAQICGLLKQPLIFNDAGVNYEDFWVPELSGLWKQVNIEASHSYVILL